jgi:hypothetical protein
MSVRRDRHLVQSYLILNHGVARYGGQFWALRGTHAATSKDCLRRCLVPRARTCWGFDLLALVVVVALYRGVLAPLAFLRTIDTNGISLSA